MVSRTLINRFISGFYWIKLKSDVCFLLAHSDKQFMSWKILKTTDVIFLYNTLVFKALDDITMDMVGVGVHFGVCSPPLTHSQGNSLKNTTKLA